MNNVVAAVDLLPELQAIDDEILFKLQSRSALINVAGKYLLSGGGKRIRAALTLLAARLGDEYSFERVIHSAAAIELVHAASLVHDDLIDDADQRRRMVDGMIAWNTDWCCVYMDIGGTGLLVGEAERQGKVVVSTELGGGGHVTAEIHRLAASGLANVLRHVGVLGGEVIGRDSQPTFLMATELHNFVLAPESGLFETLVHLGQRVESGEPVGRVHFIERPDRAPETVHARTDGIVCVVRAIATTEQGDNIVVVAREADWSGLE